MNELLSEAPLAKPFPLRLKTRLMFGFLHPLLFYGVLWLPLSFLLAEIGAPDRNKREIEFLAVPIVVAALLLLGLIGSLLLSIFGRWVSRDHLFLAAAAVPVAVFVFWVITTSLF